MGAFLHPTPCVGVAGTSAQQPRPQGKIRRRTGGSAACSSTAQRWVQYLLPGINLPMLTTGHLVYHPGSEFAVSNGESHLCSNALARTLWGPDNVRPI
ncbi:hypothetical protein PSPO01_11456 [Paraphaeosphaeria sporulosa]